MTKFFSRKCLLFLVCTGLAFGAEKQIIRPDGVEPGGSFSPGILADGTLYISGQGGEDATGKIPVNFESEVKQALNNVGAVLREAGMSSSNVVSVQVYLTSADNFQRFNSVYTKYFNDPRPTRTTVVVAKLVGPGNIEITAYGQEIAEQSDPVRGPIGGTYARA